MELGPDGELLIEDRLDVVGQLRPRVLQHGVCRGS
ncbi:MAG: hypothetical protein ACI87O_002238 [Planctomycetota bacterium]|jgi:hypothetical protein